MSGRGAVLSSGGSRQQGGRRKNAAVLDRDWCLRWLPNEISTTFRRVKQDFAGFRETSVDWDWKGEFVRGEVSGRQRHSLEVANNIRKNIGVGISTRQ